MSRYAWADQGLLLPRDSGLHRSGPLPVLSILIKVDLRVQRQASPGARGYRQAVVSSGASNRGCCLSRQLRASEVPSRFPQVTALILACADAFLPVPARAGMTSSCSARRRRQEGVGSIKVFAALRHLPPLDSHPVLSCQPLLSQCAGASFNDYTGVPSCLSGGRLGKGLGSG